MDHKRKKVLVVFCILVAFSACSGGEEEASADSTAEVGVTVGSVEPAVEGGDSGSDATAVALLFDGFSGDNSSTPTSEGGETETTDGEDQGTSITTVSPGTTVEKEKLVFEAPQECEETPIQSGTTEEFIAALYRNCLFRPFDGSNQHWINQINVEKKDREWIRDVGFYRSDESRCLLGEAKYQDKCADDENEIFDTITRYEIVCASDMDAPNDRIARRLNVLCPNTEIIE